MTGKQSLLFDKDVYVRCAATVVGKKEADGPLGEMFDVAVEDDMFGKKSWEEAESHIQEMAVDKLLIKSGMTMGVSGFTSVGYPKAVPLALAASGHARELTICVGAAVGDEIDGAMVRAGLIKRRYAHQSHKDMRDAINNGSVAYSDVHISQLPMNMNQRTGPKIDVALIECSAITEQGLYPAASGGSVSALGRFMMR